MGKAIHRLALLQQCDSHPDYITADAKKTSASSPFRVLDGVLFADACPGHHHAERHVRPPQLAQQCSQCSRIGVNLAKHSHNTHVPVPGKRSDVKRIESKRNLSENAWFR